MLTKRLLNETPVWITVRIRIQNHSEKDKMKNGSNPEPNTKCERIIWITVRIRIQTHSEKNNVDNGSNPDPNTE
jgi:hypothetical protein